ncbi:SOS response-associated peptidase [Halarcobacter anaerophilus]|uniref:SOS response-associated peptidase n=1 Tax=Halarcobacter anaerophilus TaxID=877500 RepID=UPI00069914DC|nr:SOS response-associated peptidase [Halarcobacter anaerophilus]
MPGRLAIFSDTVFKEDAKTLIKNDMVGDLNKNYNIAPTLPIPALLNNGNYLYTHFGYLPSWAENRSSMNINARSESIYEKKSFRESFKSRRCIIPLNGFYEWQIEDKEKKPYFVKDIKNDYLAVAGIWDEWFDSKLDMRVVTVALITCDANEKLSKIHHRMPIILEKKDFQSWLYNENLAELIKLFKPYNGENLNIYEVTTEVNKVLFNDLSCIQQIEEKQEGQLSFF